MLGKRILSGFHVRYSCMFANITISKANRVTIPTIMLIFLCMTLLAVYAETVNTNQTALPQINVILIGDSTVASYKAENPKRGWGQMLPMFLNDKATVKNLAAPGRSTKTYINEGRWDKALKQVRPGDVVMIQFGHNDSHNKLKPEATDANTDYKSFLRKYVDDVLAKKATPILVTPMHRGTFRKNGTLSKELLPYSTALMEVAKEKHISCVDLYTQTGKIFEELGRNKIQPLFCSEKDRTHFSEKGAMFIAELVAKNLASQKTPISEYLKIPQGK